MRRITEIMFLKITVFGAPNTSQTLADSPLASLLAQFGLVLPFNFSMLKFEVCDIQKPKVMLSKTVLF
jgi:hypothetical protein